MQRIPTIQITTATNMPPMEAWGHTERRRASEGSLRIYGDQDPPTPTFFDIVLQGMKKERLERLRRQEREEGSGEDEEGEEEKEDEGTTEVGTSGDGEGTLLTQGATKEKVNGHVQGQRNEQGPGHKYRDEKGRVPLFEKYQKERRALYREMAGVDESDVEGTLPLPEVPLAVTPPPLNSATATVGQAMQTRFTNNLPRKTQQSHGQTNNGREKIDMPIRSTLMSPCRTPPSVLSMRRSSAGVTTLSTCLPSLEQILNKEKNVPEQKKTNVSNINIDSANSGSGTQPKKESSAADKWQNAKQTVVNKLSGPVLRLSDRRASASSILLDSVSQQRSEIIRSLQVSSYESTYTTDLNAQFLPSLTPLQRHLQRRKSDLALRTENTPLIQTEGHQESGRVSTPAPPLLARRRSSCTNVLDQTRDSIAGAQTHWQEEHSVPLQLGSRRGSCGTSCVSISSTLSVTTQNHSGGRRSSLSPSSKDNGVFWGHRRPSVSPSRRAVTTNPPPTFQHASFLPPMDGHRLSTSWNSSLTPSYGIEPGSNRARSSSLPSETDNADMSLLFKGDNFNIGEKKMKPTRGIPSNTEKRAMAKTPIERLKKHIEEVTAQMTTAEGLQRIATLGGSSRL